MEKRKSILDEISIIVFGGSVVGAIFVGVLVYFLLVSAGASEPLKKAIYSTLIIQLAFLVPIYFIRVLIDKYVVSKIREVTHALKEVSMGNLDYEVKAEGNNELTELAESFERMRMSMKTIIEKLEEGEL